MTVKQTNVDVLVHWSRPQCILPDQQLLTDPEKAAALLAYLPAGLGATLTQQWLDADDVGPEANLERWHQLVALLEVRWLIVAMIVDEGDNLPTTGQGPCRG